MANRDALASDANSHQTKSYTAANGESVVMSGKKHQAATNKNGVVGSKGSTAPKQARAKAVHPKIMSNKRCMVYLALSPAAPVPFDVTRAAYLKSLAIPAPAINSTKAITVKAH